MLLGTIAFVITSLAGLNISTALICCGIAILPLALFARSQYSAAIRRDWQRAKGKLQGADLRKLLTFLYYGLSFILLCVFFDQVMIDKRDGIFTGGSHNLGDLPFHLGAIFSFTDGNNFPPENPSFAGAKFSYPFIADLVTAIFIKLGSGVRDAMLVQNLAWAFSLFILIGKFVSRLTGERLAGRLAPILLFLTGGLGFFWFFQDYWINNVSLSQFLTKLPADYSINDDFAWGNSLTTLFLTQRSLLLGMPLTIVVLQYLWRIFSSESKQGSRYSTLLPTILVGLFAGMLPLIHLHSLAVLFIVTSFVFIFAPRKWEHWVVFGVAVAIVAIPELAWSLSGSAEQGQ